MNGDIGLVNPLLGMSSIITEPLTLQKIPVHLHGDKRGAPIRERRRIPPPLFEVKLCVLLGISQDTFCAMHSLFTFVILSSSAAWGTPACLVTRHWNVYVMSDISDDIDTLIKSGDDNLGNHTIPFEGNYNWTFCERLDGRTVFYSYFWWGSRFQTLALFDSHIRNMCIQPHWGVEYCYWLVRPEGFYVSPFNRSFDDSDWVFIKQWG
ncbi:hypothetical protein L6452_17310 [Arctium lappa]|uniref:Uncharacterized protein n=1 Tax=Arctium lappa TaxID=4217 RepID=A0ACB9C312_ARCLA|nr:hypothetical protein L6452_17310 [Arctium lappa]